MNTENMKRFAELTREKTRINAELSTAKKELAELSPKILNDFLDAGITKMSIDGYTLHAKTNTFVGIAEDVEIVEVSAALIKHGFGAIVKPGTRDLKTLVKSFIDDECDLPEWLSKVLKTSTETVITARKA